MLSLFDRKIFVKELDELIDGLDEVIIRKDVKLYNKLLSQLTDALVMTYDAQRRDAINDAIDYLIKQDRDKFTKADAKKIDEILLKHLSEDLEAVLKKSILDLNEKILRLGLDEVANSLKLKLSFDVSDTKAAKILGKHTLFWVQNYYSDQLQSEINEVLNSYFTGIKTLPEVARDFELQFNNKTEKGIEYFEGLAEHTTNRVRELGKISALEKAEVDYYQIKAVLDERTSEICQSMHDRIFPVKKAIEFRDGILKLKSPEDIKKFAPWRKPEDIQGISTEDLPPGMELPPYHWRCRTIVVAYF